MLNGFPGRSVGPTRRLVTGEGRKLADASLAHRGGDIPPATPPLVTAQGRPGAPADVPLADNPARPLPVLEQTERAGRHRAGIIRDEQPVARTGPAGRHRATTAADVVAASGDELIVGIADAASHLGYDNPESFRRARNRNPIPGEDKTHDGRPCWTAQVLSSWQSKRKIAGRRSTDR